ncbi:hypothetical protein HDV63DRAFT_355910 [Trichoderma sp. SZMC 28014]
MWRLYPLWLLKSCADIVIHSLEEAEERLENVKDDESIIVSASQASHSTDKHRVANILDLSHLVLFLSPSSPLLKSPSSKCSLSTHQPPSAWGPMNKSLTRPPRQVIRSAGSRRLARALGMHERVHPSTSEHTCKQACCAWSSVPAGIPCIFATTLAWWTAYKTCSVRYRVLEA